MRNTDNNKGIIIIILVAIVLIMSLMIFIYTPIKDYMKENMSSDERQTDNIPDNTDSSYISDTIADNFGDYPELYKYPFRKTDSYVTNKELYSEQGDDIEKYAQKVRDYFNILFSTGYRELASDPDKYNENLLEFYDKEDMFLNLNDETFSSPEERIEGIAEYIVTNRVNIDGKFVTDKSLVYRDNRIYVRGIAIFTIMSNDDNSCKYKTGTEYRIILDIPMKQDSEQSGAEYYHISDINDLCIISEAFS